MRHELGRAIGLAGLVAGTGSFCREFAVASNRSAVAFDPQTVSPGSNSVEIHSLGSG